MYYLSSYVSGLGDVCVKGLGVPPSMARQAVVDWGAEGSREAAAAIVKAVVKHVSQRHAPWQSEHGQSAAQRGSMRVYSRGVFSCLPPVPGDGDPLSRSLEGRDGHAHHA